jgi:hypothetical protein
VVIPVCMCLCRPAVQDDARTAVRTTVKSVTGTCSSMTPSRTPIPAGVSHCPDWKEMAVRTRWSDASVERRTLRASVLADPVPVLDLSGFFEVGRWAHVVTLYVWARCWGPFSPNLGPVGPGVAAGAAGVSPLIPQLSGLLQPSGRRPGPYCWACSSSRSSLARSRARRPSIQVAA